MRVDQLFKKMDWKLVVAVVALLVAIFAGTFWRRADVVFDERAVEIPLSDALEPVTKPPLEPTA